MKHSHIYQILPAAVIAVVLTAYLASPGMTSIANAQNVHQHDEHDDHHDHSDHDEVEHEDHEGHDAHAEDTHVQQDAHAGHDHSDDHEDEDGTIHIADDVIKEFDIQVERAKGGAIAQVIRLPGEVNFNADRIAHVTPTVAGIVKQVNYSEGDRVEAGQVMAVLNSRELAAARSEYLAANARLELARQNMQRDQRLYQEKVGTERVALEAKQAYQEAQIAAKQAGNALLALGYTSDQIETINSLDDMQFNDYELAAPISGIITQRHLAIGEVIEPGSDDSPFVVADLSTVWVNLSVYQRDLANVKAGQDVEILFTASIPSAKGKIAFVSPAVDEHTRTATARIILDNADGNKRPGLFVTGQIETSHDDANIVVPRTAITTVEDKHTMFVKIDHGFEPRPVQLGRTTDKQAEVLSGLKHGEHYAITNILALKTELSRAALEHAGHAH